MLILIIELFLVKAAGKTLQGATVEIELILQLIFSLVLDL
jgi:hypothetical protein